MEKFETNEIKIKKKEWKDAPEEYKTKIVQFLKDHFSVPSETRYKIYDPYDLEFSEGNATQQAIKTGSVHPEYIKILYEDNKPKNIHAYFKPIDKARGNDVYLKNKALEDFLNYAD